MRLERRVRMRGPAGVMRTIGAWLLVGASVSVGLAIGVSVLEGTSKGWVSRRVMEAGSLVYVSPFPPGGPDGWPMDPRPSTFEASAPWIRCRMWVTSYPTADASGLGRATDSRAQRWETGFPMRCMSWEVWSRRQWDGTYGEVDVGRYREGVTVGRATVFGAGLPRMPLRVEWGAMLVDAAAWGGLLWVVSGGVRRWRRRSRCARGCCVHCGYDLRATKVGAPCPECGAVGTPAGSD